MKSLTISIKPETADTTDLLFIARNTGDETISFLPWNTPFDELETESIEVELDGAECVFSGISAKRIMDSEAAVSLVPGGQLERIVTVERRFELSAYTVYKVSVKIDRIIAAIQAIGDGDDVTVEASPIYATLDPRRCRSNSIDEIDRLISSTEASEPEWPDRPEHPRQTIPPCPPKPFFCISPYYQNGGTCVMARFIGHPKVINSPTDTRVLKDFLLTHKKGMPKVGFFRPDNWDFPTDPTYRKWFGAYTKSRGLKVAKVLSYIFLTRGCLGYYFFIDNSADPGVIAWWRPPVSGNKIGVMGFTPLYFSLAQGGKDSRLGTVCHELSHAFAKTDDVVYGESNCIDLANRSPDQAIKNADSYQYYIEEKAAL